MGPEDEISDAQNRRAYRELIVTTLRLADSLSGVILCDKTIRQHTTGGTAFTAVLVEASSPAREPTRDPRLDRNPHR